MPFFRKNSNMTVMYNVKLEQFEGPLDLLLELIGKEKLDITDISLAQVADQYLNYLEEEREINLANLSDFLTLASKLILIKSKSLLPLLALDKEEEEEIADLAEQIAEYKKFKDVANKLKKMELSEKTSYSREVFFGVQTVFNPPSDLAVNDLKQIFENLLSQIPVMDKLKEKRIEKVISLREKINGLKRILEKRVKTTFQKLTRSGVGEKIDKVETIISFLALLEMVKQRIVVAEQVEIFNDIEISLRE